MPIFHLIGLGASRMLKSQPPNPVFVSAAFPELRSPETCFYFPLIPNKCQADTFGPPTIAKWLRRCEKKRSRALRRCPRSPVPTLYK